MDPIKLEKLLPKNKYKKQLLINNLILYSLTIFACTLFCFTPLWYPPLFSCIKIFLFVSPQINSLFFSSKFIFILSNLIIIFLVGESKILCSNTSSSSPVEFNYYKSFNENRMLDHNGSYVKKKKEAKTKKIHEEKIDVEETLERERFKVHLTAEDLNKRADDFIVRVNRQRRLEAAFFEI